MMFPEKVNALTDVAKALAVAGHNAAEGLWCLVIRGPECGNSP
jgi:hypothetical protein